MTFLLKFADKYSFALISSIFLTIIPLIFSSVLSIGIIANEALISDFSWKEWAIITVVSCITSTFAFTPPTLLALIFGYFIGWHALFPVFLMNMVAIILINIITKKIDADRFRNHLSENPKVNRILKNISKDELQFIFFAKLSPVLPFALTNFVFALSGAKLKNILLGGFLGMIPRTLVAVWTGSQAKEIKLLLENPNEGNLQKILIILLIVFSVGGILYYLIPKTDNK